MVFGGTVDDNRCSIAQRRSYWHQRRVSAEWLTNPNIFSWPDRKIAMSVAFTRGLRPNRLPGELVHSRSEFAKV